MAISKINTAGVDSNLSLSGNTSLESLTISGTVSGTGFSNYLASPPAIGGTTPAAGAFTTLSSTGNTTLGDASADTLTINAGTTIFAQGTANGVLYLNGSNVATSGSALTFDGTNFATTGAVSSGGNIYSKGTAVFFGDGVDNSASVYATDGPIKFCASGSEAMRLTSKGLLVDYTSDSGLSGKGNAIFSGNVGIGTSSPGAKLDVYAGGNGTSLRLSNPVAGTSASPNYTELLFGVQTVSSSQGYSSYIRSYNSAFENYNSFLTFGTSNASSAPTERLRIDSSGNVGIGTSSPSSLGKFAVVGGNIVANGGGAVDPEFRLNGASGGVTRSYAMGTDATQRLYWYDYTASAYRMVIDSSGNVGIGTSSPGAKLEVYDATGVLLNAVLKCTGGGGRLVSIIDNDGSGGMGVLTTNVYGSSSATGTLKLKSTCGNANRASIQIGTSELFFYTAGASTETERLRIDGSGNVRIGYSTQATNTSSGLFYPPVCSGTPTGTPTAPYSGACALLYNNSQDRLNFYNGSTWVSGSFAHPVYGNSVYTHHTNYATISSPGNSTDWIRICSFDSGNQPRYARFLVHSGSHERFLVEVSTGAGGDFVYLHVTLLGNYVYWSYYPMQWRIVPAGTNAPTHIDVRYSAGNAVVISESITILENFAYNGQKASFPGTNVGSANDGYGVQMGTSSGFSYNEIWIRPGTYARISSTDLSRTNGTMTAGTVVT